MHKIHISTCHMLSLSWQFYIQNWFLLHTAHNQMPTAAVAGAENMMHVLNNSMICITTRCQQTCKRCSTTLLPCSAEMASSASPAIYSHIFQENICGFHTWSKYHITYMCGHKQMSVLLVAVGEKSNICIHRRYRSNKYGQGVKVEWWLWWCYGCCC